MSKQSNPGTTPDVSHVANPDIAHERSDVNVRAIMWFILGLLISGIAIHLVIGGLYKYLDARETKLEAPPVSLVAPQGERLPPEPRLQTKPQQDLKQLRAEEDATRIRMNAHHRASRGRDSALRIRDRRALRQRPPAPQRHRPAQRQGENNQNQPGRSCHR